MTTTKPTLFGSAKPRIGGNKRKQSAHQTMIAPSKPPKNTSTQTLHDYLLQHFLLQPVSIFTEAGRVQGKVIEVTQENVQLDTTTGSRTIDLHAIFSVAHQLAPR